MRGEQSWPRALSRAGTQTEGAGLPAWTREANRGLLSQQTRKTIVILFSCQVFALSACLWGDSPRCGDSVNCPPREPRQWAVRVGGVSPGTSQNRTERGNEAKLLRRGRRAHTDLQERRRLRAAAARPEGQDERSETRAVLFILLSKERTVSSDYLS